MKLMSSGTGKIFDTEVQVLQENQIVVSYGYMESSSRYVVHKVEFEYGGYIYCLIDLETKEFAKAGAVRPLHEKFGIGYYYNALQPEFMDAFEVAILRSEAERKEKREQAEANAVPEAVTGNFIIVDYSEKALAVFGDTKPIKDELKALGGRFNPKLTHNDKKQAGWIFSKSKERELRNLLTIK